MAGLAAGSAASARWARRFPRPLAAYGVAELAIGAAGLAVYAVLRGAANGIGPIGLNEEGALHSALERFAVAGAILLLPTALMGATLPLLVRHVSGDVTPEGRAASSGPGLAVGVLYGLNTLGAACGCFTAGFFLIRILGTAATNRVAVGLNFVIGIAALVAGLWPATRREPAAAPVLQSAQARSEPAVATPLFLGFACFACGYLSLSNEVLFGRLLAWLLGNRVYANATMLTAFLLGIALGSLVAGWIADAADRMPPTSGGRTEPADADVWIFSCCQILAGLSVIAALLWFPEVLAAARRAEAAVGYERTWAIVRIRLGEALAVVAVPALMSGASFPALVRAIHRSGGELASSTGAGYALNTLGCILGSLVTGFWLIPALGTYASTVLVAVCSILLGHRILADRWGTAGRGRRTASLAVVAALAGLAAAAALRHPRYPFPREGLELVWSREEPAALITVWKGGLGWNLYGDDTPLSFPIGPGSAAARVQRLQAWLPLLLHPHPRRVLVIGLGFGVTTGAFASSGVPESVETVELFRGAIDCASLFKDSNGDPGTMPRSVMVAGDGRYYLRHGGTGWDVIAANLTGPDLPGSAALYTREFFELARSKLNPGGLFLAHAYGPGRDVILRTVGRVFPHVTGWRGYRTSLYLIAGIEPAALDPVDFDRRLAEYPALREALRAGGLRRFRDVAALRVLDEAAFRRLADRPDLPVNSDEFPVLEYRMTANARDLFHAHY